MKRVSPESESEPESESGRSPLLPGAIPDSDSGAARLDSDSGSFAQLLLQHYDAHRRDLPWRQDADPYRVWISEVMLQQTRVETVVPYYRRWLERFPDVGRLADAPADDVLKQWEGLGYYGRARNLHQAAGLVRDRHAGALPSDPALLRALPGFGEYTVGAVASIAFGRRLPAVDGNVRRVLSRIHDRATPTPAWLRATAAALVPADRPGDFNQALMELGATICTPRSPRCPDCPLRGLCLARARGTVDDVPARRRRAAVPTVELATAVVRDAAGRLLLVRNPDAGLLGGLWGFPVAEPAPGEPPLRAAAGAAVRAGATVHDAEGAELPPVRHQFSHLTATYRPFLFEGAPALPPPETAASARWLTPDEIRAHALPVAQRRILAHARA